ncbi:MAG: hypothetical protein CMB02_04410 [Euryarchaeota archaeon]|nr:hypothetical protein [Euryarchaeota archaeon]
MGDVGMHAQNQGGRLTRPPNQNSKEGKGFGTGLRKIRNRARSLSNAVGYDSRDVPRVRRNSNK